MSTTTPAEIRSLIASRVAALTPSLHAGDRFIEHRYEQPIAEWASDNPTGCLRRFSVRQGGAVAPPQVSDGRTEWVEQDFLVTVSYPVDGKGRFGARLLVDLDNVVERDRTQIANSVGTNSAPYADATITTEGEDRVDLGAVTLAIVQLRVRYFRDGRSS